MIENLKSAWCQFNTINKTKVNLNVFTSPNTTEHNEKVPLGFLELANEYMSSNDKTCIMGDFNYPSKNGMVSQC